MARRRSREANGEENFTFRNADFEGLQSNIMETEKFNKFISKFSEKHEYLNINYDGKEVTMQLA